MSDFSPIFVVLLVIGGLILVFLITRELICWYSKINERIILQKRTNHLLELVIKQLGGQLELKSEDDGEKDKS